MRIARANWWVALWLAVMATAAVAMQAPDALVREATEALLAPLREDPSIASDPQRLRALAERTVVPHFDFETLARWVLGKHWRRASPEQRRQFVAAFRDMLIRTYSAALQDYREPQIRYFPPRLAPSGRHATVRTRITQPGTQLSVDVQYRLMAKDGQWKVYDVVIDGVSLAANYRTSFDREIQQVGLDGLIARLQTRTQPIGTN